MSEKKIAATVEAGRSFRDRAAVAGAELRAGIEEIRQGILDLRDERAALTKANVTKEMALERAEGWLALLENRKDGGSLVPTPDYFAVGEKYRHFTTPASDAISFYLFPLLKNAVRAEVDEFYRTAEFTTEEDRAEQIRLLEAKILDAELAEESIIRSAEASGFHVLRRPDADPRAVLAADEALP